MDRATMMQAIIRGETVLIDEQDAHFLERYSWRIEDGYIKAGTTTSSGKRVTLYLHRLIAGAQKGQIVDHINGIRSDNRRGNLRIVNSRQNALNAAPKQTGKKDHGFRGLKKNRCGAYEAIIRHGGRQIYLGIWKNPAEAAYNYDIASLKLHGEYGRRNFLPLVADSQ